MNKKLILAAVVIAIAVALVVGPTILAGGTEKSAGPGGPGMGRPGAGGGQRASAEETVYSVKAEKAVRTTLQSYIEVNGDVVADRTVAVVPDAAGKLVSLNVEVGTQVTKGSLIAEVDPSKPGTAYSLSPVHAPISGTVVSAPLSVGSTVSTATTIAVVGVMDQLEVEAKIPEREVGQLRVGLKAEVSLEAFPGETFDAVVARVSPVVDASSRTKAITLKFVKNDAGLNAGMFARIKLDTVAYPNRIAVPEEAVTALRGSDYVYVVSGETVVLREVELGVTVDGMTEIREGLAEGETVVTQGQQLLSDGAKVRVVNAGGEA